MTKRILITVMVALTIVVIAACAGEEATTETTGTEPRTTEQTEPEVTQPSVLSEGFATPESVLYDPATDVYFVSNINGQPLDVDDNGFISRINAGDRTTNVKWIDGEEDDVELNAPKGMAIVGDELWVTDIDQIRRFDIASGDSAGTIPVPGATFLNDLTAGPDGAAYTSDSGMKAGAGGFEPAGTDAVYRITTDGEIESLASGEDLNGPNGLLVSDGAVWVVTFNSNELYRLVDGEKSDVVTLPAGGLDGIAQAADGQLLISSWEGSAVFRGPTTGPFEPVAENLQSPADLGVDSKRNLLLIPLFQENRVVLSPLDHD